MYLYPQQREAETGAFPESRSLSPVCLAETPSLSSKIKMSENEAKRDSKPGMGEHASQCLGVETGRLKVQDECQLHGEFQVSLSSD